MTDYLLSPTHPAGRGKAKFFTHFGFARERWEVLARALADHAADHEIARTEESPFGTRYIIEGEIETPDGRRPMVRSVWFVDHGEDIPRFVTAYALEVGGSSDVTGTG